MLHHAIVFMVIAPVAAVFEFGGTASSAAGIAQILFVLFLILALAAFFVGRRKQQGLDLVGQRLSMQWPASPGSSAM